MKKKWLRISIGVVFAIFLIVTFIPKIYLSNSSDGVVNARTLTVRSPIEGMVQYDESLRHGAFFKKGQVIGTVTNDRLDSSFLHGLETEKITLESRVEIMKKRLENYQKLSDDLKKSLRKYQEFSEKQYQMQILQINAQLKREQAELSRLKVANDGNEKLYEKKAIRLRDLENSRSEVLQSEAKILELVGRCDELKNRLEAVLNGVFMGDGNNDVPYSNQRRDQLVIEMALADAALLESQERIKGISKQIEIEQARLADVKKYQIKAPFDCLVWRFPAGNQSSVAINSELVVLMDCGTIFLDVVVPERMFSQTPRGERVEYRLRGEEEFHDGMITARRGSGTQGQVYELAAMVINDPQKEFRVWVQVDHNDMGLSPENFYRVGQRVDVKLIKNINPIKDVIRFFNVF